MKDQTAKIDVLFDPILVPISRVLKSFMKIRTDHHNFEKQLPKL